MKARVYIRGINILVFRNYQIFKLNSKCFDICISINFLDCISMVSLYNKKHLQKKKKKKKKKKKERKYVADNC